MREIPEPVVALLQYVELHNAGWWDDAIDKFVLAILWINNNEPLNLQQLKRKLSEQIGIDLKQTELRSALDRLIKKEKISLKAENYFLCAAEKDTIYTTINSSKELEKKVSERFTSIVSEVSPDLLNFVTWNQFKDQLIIPLVKDAGVKLYEFFVYKSKNSPWVSCIDEYLKTFPCQHHDHIRNIINLVLDPENQEVSSYILSYLDAYLNIYVTGLPKKIRNELNDPKLKYEFIIFLDTNVIFSILGLHSNPSNEAVIDLMDLVNSTEDLNVSFVVHPNTIKETQDTISFYHGKLENAPYPKNLAEAAKVVGVSGVYKKFFERTSEVGAPINPSDYFSPYEKNLIEILQAKGISTFQLEKPLNHTETQKLFKDIDDQILFEKEKYRENAKGEDQIINDVTLWHFINDLRGQQITSPITSKYWILTIDYRLLSFDRYKNNKTPMVNVCLHPLQLTQLLRFFTPTSPETAKILLGTTFFPIISGGLSPKSEQVVIKILNKLARFEGIDDVPVESITTILSNDALLTKLQNGLSDLEEIHIIRDLLTEQVSAQADQIKKQEEKIMTQFEILAEKDRDIKELEKKIRELESRLESDKTIINGFSSTIQEINDEKDQKKANKNRLLFILTLLGLVTPYLVFIIIISLIPNFSEVRILTGNGIKEFGLLIFIILLISFIYLKLFFFIGGQIDYIKDWPLFLSAKQKWKISSVILVIFGIVFEFLINQFLSSINK